MIIRSFIVRLLKLTTVRELTVFAEIVENVEQQPQSNAGREPNLN